MDLMRTLLVYMSATLTLAVQNTAAPKVTPTPSPAPDATAVVETVETPEPGEEVITATPAPTDKITPAPVPTITPNTKAYHNLTMGAKGKEVRKLQEKLIELGYLPEGAADGGYGRQTYNAVKKFQYYNGLKADGIAGRATQTNLFENKDIVPNPEVTAAPETKAPKATKTPKGNVKQIETPEVTKAPKATKKPKNTDTPKPTKKPKNTATPKPTKKPKATEAPEVTEAPKATEAPAEAAEEVTKAPEAPEAPEVTEAPEITEAPEVTEAPEITEAPEMTEAPEITEAPEETEVPKAAEEPEEEIPEIIENVDLDAEEYEPIAAVIALNEGNGPLEFIATEDGVPVMAKPRMGQNGAKIRVSLDDLCKAIDGWKLTDDGVGTVVLEAAGYTLALYSEDDGLSATVDGTQIPMKDDDYDFISEGHFINAEFLATALKGEAVWDQEENTLMLRIRDKAAVESKD